MKLLFGLRKSGGRNNRGRVTVRHRGGGHKRLYRHLEYSYNNYNYLLSGKIKSIVYDPNRTAFIAACLNGNKLFFKILGGIHNFDLIGKNIQVVKLKNVGIGDEIFNVSLNAGQLGKIGRASGAKCKVLKQSDNYTVIRMPSHQIKVLNNENFCILGSVFSKPLKVLRKAGRNR
jgi:large subunit ribosomal protein L2